MATVMERVRQAIDEITVGHEVEVHLEYEPDGKITGEIVSDAFEGVSPTERQIRFRSRLAELLDVEERRRVGFIMTITPNEKQILSETA
jgi:hypothetical protein